MLLQSGWPVRLEAVSQLVVGKNYDPTNQHYLSCQILPVVLPIITVYLVVRHRVSSPA